MQMEGVHLYPARPGSAPGFRIILTARFILAALSGAAPALRADGVKDQRPFIMDTMEVDATKTHTLFMGADIAVNLDRDSYPVRNVVGSSWVVTINGDERVISSKKGAVNLKITPDLKLTESSATIVGFRKGPAYSYDNDPNVRLTRAMTRSGEITSDLLTIAANAQHLQDIETVNKFGNNPWGGMAVLASSDNQFGDAALMATAKMAGAMLHPAAATGGASLASHAPPASPLTPSSFASGGGDYAGGGLGNSFAASMANAGAANSAAQAGSAAEATGKIASSGIDALDIEFTISAAKPLSDPYVVTMTRFHTPGGKPGFVTALVYARALDPIDGRLSQVHFTEDGFPFNYELVDFQLHLYNHGVEVATNLATNRVELTREEAFEYVKMEYLGSHPKDTLPASPAMGQLPPEFPGRVASGKYSQPIYVQVNKDGRSVQVFADAACTQRIDDPFVAAVARSIRFKPALASGQPVAGVATLDLNKLVL
jgi:hypothetical protein